jgi:tetratricopeptide (TPR) repeat protein
MGLQSLARYRFYLRKRPVTLVILSALAIAFFLTVTALSRAYRAQRDGLGNRWFTRGVADLNAGKYDAAAREFRAALLYSRDDYAYQLNLAEALIGMHHSGEASAYLLNLWDRQPENGLVNVELARIAAQQGRTDDAIRYYHDAVYAAWQPNEEQKRRAARMELIELLLKLHEDTQAQSELIALAANVGEDPTQQARIGDLFLQANDYEHALAAYRTSLRSYRHNAAALAGAGNAAFQLGMYPVALRYLQAAVTENPEDKESANLLKTTEAVLHMDPFRRQISAAERNRIVMEAFTTAGERLNCAPPKTAATGMPSSLHDEWSRMKPQLTEAGLRRNPDLVEAAMDLVFRIERETTNVCGPPSGTDLALLLIAKLHEGS